ncbi:MAG: MOSC domain-containing protein [Proteobacteria bacterium]|nr:MOSC domain-containing protein [Pseudomonadota bacterium]
MTTPPELSAKITALYVGKVEERWPGKAPSAIGKKPTNEPLHLEENGFVEDAQADLKVHGGPEKALHHYAADHMNFWRRMFPDKAEIFVPSCFGENISTVGMIEETLCLGDILTLGTATVEICQGRQPCWKLSAHTGLKQMAAVFQKSGRTGWYYRVKEPGIVQAGDEIRLQHRAHAAWPLSRVISARFDRNIRPEDATALSRLPALSASWREAFEKKGQKGFQENTDARLKS